MRGNEMKAQETLEQIAKKIAAAPFRSRRLCGVEEEEVVMRHRLLYVKPAWRGV